MKQCLYKRVIVPTTLYGAEAWGKSAERREVNVLKMKCLRCLVWVSWMDWVRNEEVRWRAGIERELASRMDQGVLRWFGLVERMDEYLSLEAGWWHNLVEGVGWMDGYGYVGWMTEVMLVGWMVWRWFPWAADGLECRLEDNGRTIGWSGEPSSIWVWLSSRDHFCLVPVLFRTTLLHSGGLSPREGWDGVTWCSCGKLWKKGATTENQGAGVWYMR